MPAVFSLYFAQASSVFLNHIFCYYLLIYTFFKKLLAYISLIVVLFYLEIISSRTMSIYLLLICGLPSMVQCSDKLGLSLELGSFAAGVMISTTDLAQHTLEQVIPC